MADITLYYLHGNGSVSQRTGTGTDPLPPADAVEITAEEYAQHLGEIKAANEQEIAEALAAEEQERHDDYDALIALNVPEATARRLSGYTPAGGETS